MKKKVEIDVDYEELVKELTKLSKEIKLSNDDIEIQSAKTEDLIKLLNALNQTKENLRVLRSIIE